ncbi:MULTISPECIES: energy transducer TonB [unclassified Rhodanobacter]|uniref:energy transducer TonB n=1 Tax=unclassified Rhodanobacter TaxID=2621553 RepID=UPI001BE0CF69|nr:MULTISPECIES: energy transducer TonB [unclassified Rhodanobacter]MBT2145611.1 energy transducer TonB [Rhodanobacter sp. LX-99]MBT2149656.1 energy transducer TonB [Rhodanobacter sp. LX-100]
MDTRYILDTRRHARGAVRPLVIAIIAIFALLAVGAWFLIIKPHQELVMADSGGHPSTPVSTATRTAPPPANVAAMDLNQLLAEARTAMNEQRYLAPAGNNAFEFYLRVLEKEPGNKVASDALRETFPFAATSAEQAINSRDFGEAQRQIDLLAKADPANFTLTILRSKLDAQRKTLDKQQQLALDQEKAAQLAAQKAAADKLAADKLAEQQKAQLAEQQKAEQASAAQQPRQQAAANTAAGGDNAAGADSGSAAGATMAAVLVKGSPARYPTAAMRARQEGWVVVSFTVDPDGKTSDVKVVESQPRHVFDRAAIDAVERYRFNPAMKDGTAVSSVKQQRIEFKL